MEEAEIKLKGRPLRSFPKLKERFEGLGFTTVRSDKRSLTLEKIETSDLKGKSHHFYCISFQPDKLVLAYSVGPSSKKRQLEALHTLLNAIKIADGLYEIDAQSLCEHFESQVREDLTYSDSEQYATAQQVSELSEKYSLLEKKYRDLVLSSEQNARILLECEKKRDEYYGRIRQLEGMSDESLRQALFKWLRAHSGEINISEFAKMHNVPNSRVEEGLEHLVKNGYIRKKS